MVGSSTLLSRWVTTPIGSSEPEHSRARRSDFSRPTVMGMTMPGKSTVLRIGSSATTEGNSSSLIRTSSSAERMGMTLDSALKKLPMARISFIISIGYNTKTDLFRISEKVSENTKNMYYLDLPASKWRAYLLRNLSTRPAVSTSFILPVKKG